MHFSPRNTQNTRKARKIGLIHASNAKLIRVVCDIFPVSLRSLRSFAANRFSPPRSPRLRVKSLRLSAFRVFGVFRGEERQV